VIKLNDVTGVSLSTENTINDRKDVDLDDIPSVNFDKTSIVINAKLYKDENGELKATIDLGAGISR
jgi:hypothetical protein